MLYLSKISLITFTTLLVLLSGCDTRHSSDGEGSAVIDIDHITAGSLSRFKVIYTVGDSGIKVGGGVSIGLHHASDWKMQVFSGKGKNFLSAVHLRKRIYVDRSSVSGTTCRAESPEISEFLLREGAAVVNTHENNNLHVVCPLFHLAATEDREFISFQALVNTGKQGRQTYCSLFDTSGELNSPSNRSHSKKLSNEVQELFVSETSFETSSSSLGLRCIISPNDSINAIETRVTWLENKREEMELSYARLKINEMFENQRPQQFSDRVFNKIFRVVTREVQMLPGDKIEFTFGANEHLLRAQSYADPQHEIRLSSDIDGDGTYEGISSNLLFSILPSKTFGLSATADSQIESGKPFRLLVRAEDEFFNLQRDFDGIVYVRDEYEELIGEISLVDGIGVGEIKLNSLGAHRLRLQAENPGLTGRSNPIRVFTKAPDVKLFWGDIHGHTGISDGLGRTREAYFRYGRDVAALDVIALTDHGQVDWRGNQLAAQKFNDPGKFITILAQEAGVVPDHMNIYYRKDDMDHLKQWTMSYEGFQDSICQQFNSVENDAMTSPHHFSYGRQGRSNPRYPFGYWNSRVARFIEVYSSHGASEYPGNPRPLIHPYQGYDKYMQGGLKKGLRFGVVGASDNHDSHPGRSGWGRYPSGLSAFWASELTRDSIWDSLWNYRVYATSFDRIYMEFRINASNMGSQLVSDAAKIDGYVIGKTDNLEVTLIKDNKKIKTWITDTGVVEFSHLDASIYGNHFYYLRATQSNGEQAWSTPIWISSSDTATSESVINHSNDDIRLHKELNDIDC